MSLKKWIESLLNPAQTNFDSEETKDDLIQAFNDGNVRTVWFQLIEEELRNINVRFDRQMASEQCGKFYEDMYRRKGILFALNAIVDAKHKLESSQEDQMRQNRYFEKFQGAAAPLNLEQRQS